MKALAISTIQFLFGALLFLPATVRADYYTEYLWYRVLPEQNRIVLTIETLVEHDAVDAFIKNRRAHEKEGKYWTYDYKKGAGRKNPNTAILFEERLNGHDVRTEVLIRHPRGHGYCGAVPLVEVKIHVDGKLRMDAHMGFYFYHYTIPRVEIHADGASSSIQAEVLHDLLPSQTGRAPPLILSFKEFPDAYIGHTNGTIAIRQPPGQNSPF